MKLRQLFHVEVALAIVFACACFVTFLWPDWIELVFGPDPDQGSGAAEWGIASALGLLAVLCCLLARVEWRRVRRRLPDPTAS